jgi:hypothetical protein
MMEPGTTMNRRAERDDWRVVSVAQMLRGNCTIWRRTTRKIAADLESGAIGVRHPELLSPKQRGD